MITLISHKLAASSLLAKITHRLCFPGVFLSTQSCRNWFLTRVKCNLAKNNSVLSSYGLIWTSCLHHTSDLHYFMVKSIGKDTNVIRTSIILSDVLKFFSSATVWNNRNGLGPSIFTLHYRIIQNGAFYSRYILSLTSREKYHYNTWQLLTSIHPIINSTMADAWAKRPSLASPRPLCPDVGSPGVPRPAGNPPRSSPGLPLWGTCLENLSMELSRSHPEQMSESSGSSCC